MALLIEFRNVYDEGELAERALYKLLLERPAIANISHREVPSLNNHIRFVRSRPYAHWLLIVAPTIIQGDVQAVGALSATTRNEIGIAIFKLHQRRGYASEALYRFITEYQPLPAQASVRAGRWLANIAPENEASKSFFIGRGFKKIQETYAL